MTKNSANSYQFKAINPGDRVSLLAPGMVPAKGTLPKAVNFLTEWGLEASYPKKMLSYKTLSANTLALRLQFLRQALEDNSTTCIWCLRGGYGSLELLPYLEKMKRPKKSKLLVGFSDITSLHTFFNQKWGWQSIHGAHLDTLSAGNLAKNQVAVLKKVIFGQTAALSYSGLKPVNAAAKKVKRLNGVLAGGNLITLQSSFGTKWQVDTKGKILFIEDIGERAYKLHRVLEQMNQLNMFKSMKALVLGGFTGSKEPSGKDLVPKMFTDFFSDLKVPVFKGLPSGHGSKQWPLVLGASSVITAHKSKFQLDIKIGG